MLPDSTYAKWATWHESVPAIGLTFSDHFHPGSNVPSATAWPASCTTFARPFPSNSRVSSGESKRLISAAMDSFRRFELASTVHPCRSPNNRARRQGDPGPPAAPPPGRARGYFALFAFPGLSRTFTLVRGSLTLRGLGL